MPHAPSNRRSAFTLIELLMVIAIIGILIGLLVPAVMFARRTIMQRAMVMEVKTLANAVDQYKNKFGDYPPDGTDEAILRRHCRKLFPNMAATEMTLLIAGSNSSAPMSDPIMDPSEAIVFFLGGFSKDPVHPFTGPGGPFASTPSGSTSPLQYNVDRNEPFYEFNEAQLTLIVFDDNGNPITVSNDESTFGLPTPSGFPGDLIPVYHPKGKVAPLVYFDSRTYSLGGTFFNQYNIGSFGVARPYKAGKDGGYDVNTKVTFVPSPSSPAAVANNDRYYRYMNERTYQLISAGLDDSYGGVPASSGPPTFFCFPNGNSLNIAEGPMQTHLNRYTEVADGVPSAQLDNATSFADGILADDLQN